MINIAKRNVQIDYIISASFPSNICKELLSKQIIFLPVIELLFTYVNGTSNVRQQRITLNSEIKVCLCEGGLDVA